MGLVMVLPTELPGYERSIDSPAEGEPYITEDSNVRVHCMQYGGFLVLKHVCEEGGEGCLWYVCY